MWRGYSLIINLLLTLRGITATIPDTETTIINLCSCGMEWQECASACPLTCSNYSMSSIDDCAETCSEGCGCPEGKVLLDGVCVTTSTCASAVFNNQKTIINYVPYYTGCDECCEGQICSAVISGDCKTVICENPTAGTYNVHIICFVI